MADGFELVAGKQVIVKDPNAALDYTLDYSAWLQAGETIATATVTTSGGVTKDSSTIAGGTKVVMWISGGTVGTQGSATVHVATNAATPRVDDRTVYFKIKER